MSRDYGYGTMQAVQSSEHEQDVTGLCNSIGFNIQTIQTNSSKIEKGIKVIGTSQDSPQYRDNVCEAQKQTNGLISKTSADLGHLTSLVRGDSKQRRLQVEKLKNDFEVVLNKYSDKQMMYLNKVRKTMIVTDLYRNEEPQTDPDAQLMQQQLQYQIQMDDAQTREVQMNQILSVVVDVNDIMNQLASQITQQGANITSIEGNIESVQGNVEQGAAELQKATTYQNKYRKKVLILLLIAIIVGIIITAVVISDVKN